MKRALIRALLLGLVPVLVITARPEVASATIKLGTVNTVHYDPGGTSTPADDTDCASNFYWSRTDLAPATISVYGTGCSTGYNISSLTVSFHVKGAGCDFYGGPSAELDGTGTSGHFNTLVGDAATDSAMNGVVGPTCSPTQFCTTASIDTHAGWMTPGTGGGEERCVTIAMGPPPAGAAPVSNGTCPNGVVTAPIPGDTAWRAIPGYAPIQGGMGWSQYVTGGVTATGTGTGTWSMYVIVQHTDGSTSAWRGNSGLGPVAYAGIGWADRMSKGVAGTAGVSVPINMTDNGIRMSSHSTSATSDRAVAGQIIGVGYQYGAVGNWLTAVPSSASGWSSTSGRLGVTDPSACLFYWGTKLWNDTTVTTDEPVGSVPSGPAGPDDPTPTDPDPTLPEPTTDGCAGFSFTDPSSWAGAGICELVKAIGALVGVVRGLFGIVQQVLTWLLGLLDNLRGLFVELFVPDPASWDTDGLMTQLEARPPASILADIAAGMASMVAAYNGAGCGTLVHFGADVDQSITCSQVKSIPGWNALYALMQVALFSLTGLAVYRMLSGVFEKG